jgi:hypothetical protein
MDGGSGTSGGSSGGLDADGGLDAGDPVDAGDVPDAATSSIVQMRVSGVDDFVYAFVGGVRRSVWKLGDARDGQIVDVTSWFAAGTNELRLFAMNTGGPTAFRVELWVDGSMKLDASCATTSCTAEEVGIVYDETFEIALDQGPELEAVEIASATPGALYLGAEGDDVTATGLVTPTTLWLPPGRYTLGLGIASDVPFEYTGSYHEQVVDVGTEPIRVDLSSTPALSVQNTTRIAILPIRETNNCTGPLDDVCLDPPDASNIGVLQESDIAQFEAQTQAIVDEWLEPFSYGLMSFDIDVLPVVEDRPLRELAPGVWDTSCFIADSQTAQRALQDYEMVLFFYSQHKASGEKVTGEHNAAWPAESRHVFLSTLFTRQSDMTNAFGPGAPNQYLIWSMLYNFDGCHRDVRGYYPGLEGASGARSHAYPDEGVSGETGYVAFYRLYVRGLVAERSDMRVGSMPPAVPSEADIFTGIFETMRRGVALPPYQPTACVR